jgi:heme-degrading monooxygenase HmoA
VYKIEDTGMLPRERYIASNRFVLRDGAGPKFEARWANRKSRLATLDGFKYFTLMRRVPVEGIKEAYDDDYSYVSFTSWDSKPAFNAWRTGDAFKEAHGGTSIGAFLTTMVSSLLVLKGPPSPIFWDGLLHQSVVPQSVPETEGGWRVVETDGNEELPAEAFIACNRFSVLPGMEKAFEERWANRESSLKSFDGFVSFTMLRRDFKTKMHGSDTAKTGDTCNYQSTTIWKNKEAFLNWRNSQDFNKVHSGGGKPAGGADAPKPAPMWSAPPKPTFYEGVLVISSEGGA